jgi:ATP-dependent protease HslVU (ClpYQ) ATPase subunit
MTRSAFTPRETVGELDRYIIGQQAGQARRRGGAAQPLAPAAGAG